MNTIATLFLCFVFITAVFCQMNAELEAIHQECKPQSGVSEEVVTKARNGEFVDDPKLKAHLVCFAKKLGILNDSGKIQIDVARASLMETVNDSAVVDEMMTKCAVEKGSPEETMFESLKCMNAIRQIV